MTVTILTGDCRDVLRSLAPESVHCVCTSPPYWGLRDYGVAGQIGLEAEYPEFVDKLVETFRDVRRVLRADGTLWLNLGDSYASNGGAHNGRDDNQRGVGAKRVHNNGAGDQGNRLPPANLKPKDLCGIPWRVAFALQADGWYLRQDIIWSKPNPMPESVRDRCTKAHEYIFLLSKSERYFFDAETIAEPIAASSLERYNYAIPRSSENHKGKLNRWGGDTRKGQMIPKKHYQLVVDDEGLRAEADVAGQPQTRNKRSVWEIPTSPFPEAHFATFPPALIKPCVLAGCPKSGTVLDPFGGAGTTGLVADRLGRNAVLIELNPEYAAMAERRIKGDAPLFAEVVA